MSYADYGLQANKTAVDAAGPGPSYCPWCGDNKVATGFSMCFAGFCICPACAFTATAVEAQHRWRLTDHCGCFKCGKVGVPAFVDAFNSLDLCWECVGWAATTLRRRLQLNRQAVKPATRFKVPSFKNRP